jgi:hypothetical protein
MLKWKRGGRKKKSRQTTAMSEVREACQNPHKDAAATTTIKKRLLMASRFTLRTKPQ